MNDAAENRRKRPVHVSFQDVAHKESSGGEFGKSLQKNEVAIHKKPPDANFRIIYRPAIETHSRQLPCRDAQVYQRGAPESSQTPRREAAHKNAHVLYAIFGDRFSSNAPAEFPPSR